MVGIERGSIWGQLVQSHFNSEGRHCKCKYPRTHKCGRCSCCQFLWPGKTHTLPNGEIHQAKQVTSCQTMGIVYLMTCVCSYYVGKTKRNFLQQIYEHVSAIKGGCDITSPIGRHGRWKHNKTPHSVRFFALERIHTDIRGGVWYRLILQREAKWIHHLGATQSPGLNDVIRFKPFFIKFSLAFSCYLLT